MSGYAQKVRSWVYETVRDFGGRIPPGYQLNFSSSLPDEQLEENALKLYQLVKSNRNGHYSNGQQNSKPARMIDLVPHESSDGSVTFLDRCTHRVIAGADRMPNGLFSYYGPDYMIETLFGRGGLDRMWVRTEDNMFFRDRHKKRKDE